VLRPNANSTVEPGLDTEVRSRASVNNEIEAILDHGPTVAGQIGTTPRVDEARPREEQLVATVPPVAGSDVLHSKRAEADKRERAKDKQRREEPAEDEAQLSTGKWLAKFGLRKVNLATKQYFAFAPGGEFKKDIKITETQAVEAYVKYLIANGVPEARAREKVQEQLGE